MKRDKNLFKVVGLLVAAFLVAFGNIHNFWRTVRLGLNRLNKKNR